MIIKKKKKRHISYLVILTSQENRCVCGNVTPSLLFFLFGSRSSFVSSPSHHHIDQMEMTFVLAVLLSFCLFTVTEEEKKKQTKKKKKKVKEIEGGGEKCLNG